MSDANEVTAKKRSASASTLLETRLTFQDETIETLNKTITEQWLKIDALTRQVAHLGERLQEAEANAPAPPTNRRRITELRSSRFTP